MYRRTYIKHSLKKSKTERAAVVVGLNALVLEYPYTVVQDYDKILLYRRWFKITMQYEISSPSVKYTLPNWFNIMYLLAVICVLIFRWES